MQFDTLFVKDRALGGREGLREILAALLHRLLLGLFGVLEKRLHLVGDSNGIISIMTQLSFCSASFSKIGFEFRLLLVPLYERAIVKMTSEALGRASHEFTGMIEEGMKEDRLPSKVFTSAERASVVEHVTVSITAQTPPSGLTEIPLFAKFLNTVIVTLNNLRLLAPAGMLGEISGRYAECLSSCTAGLEKYVRTWQTRGKSRPGEEDWIVRVAGRAYVEQLVPFVWKALYEGVFGGATRPDERLDGVASGLRALLE